MMLIFAIILAFSSLCSAAMQPKIIGGSNAKIEDWPFIAFIVYYGTDESVLPACGGSLLSSQTILTAAHCLDDITNNKKDFHKYQAIYVLMGHANIYKSSLLRTGIDYLTHSKYDLEDTQYDIGILLLDYPVTFSNTVKKTVLWTKPLKVTDEQMLYVAGWGSTETAEDAPLSKKLQYLSHKLIPTKVCKLRLPHLDLEKGTICAGTPKTTQFVFSGDSGGPLVTAGGFQVGIVSYKLEDSDGVTIFTSIPDYAGWIEEAQAKLIKKHKCGG